MQEVATPDHFSLAVVKLVAELIWSLLHFILPISPGRLDGSSSLLSHHYKLSEEVELVHHAATVVHVFYQSVQKL